MVDIRSSIRPVHLKVLLLIFLLAGQVTCTDNQPTNLRIVGKPPFEPGASDRITVDGITWYFDKAYPVGTFANGDYWVAGDTVVITKISPDFDGQHHGWEVNPVVEGGQGFSIDLNDFEPSLVPTLPYKAIPVSSIVKTIRSDKVRGYICRQCIQTAAVLTIVSQPVSDTTLFRPPYVGTEKPFYSTNDLRTDLLPSLSPAENTPAFSSFSEISNLQLDHKNGATGTELHPINSFVDDYGAYIGMRNADAALRLMLNDALTQKMPLLISYVQYGIDLLYLLPLGFRYEDGGGHRPGQKLPMAFAAVMLDDANMKKRLKESVHLFHEKILLTYNRDSTRVLFGDDQGLSPTLHEEMYWKVVQSYVKDGTYAGYKSYRDPYGYIDGGGYPGSNYQYCCTSQPWKGSVLAVKLMPALFDVWNDTMTIRYVERWVDIGAHSQPDPCAPADSSWENYGITYGPDGNGGCIKDMDTTDGIGRFPSEHGKYVDEGHYRSNFQKSLWSRYYH